jgi:hypothetical protein
MGFQILQYKLKQSRTTFNLFDRIVVVLIDYSNCSEISGLCKCIIYKIVFILILLQFFKCVDIIIIIIIIIIMKYVNIKLITSVVVTSLIIMEKIAR